MSDPEPMDSVIKPSARQVALDCLERTRRDRAWSGAAIDAAIRRYALDPREGALSARLTLGVLQNSSLCDFYISCYCQGKLEPKVRDILRLGAYQLLFMDKIPPRAAVSESVELARSNGYGRASGLVNAVLRKIADNRQGLPPVPGEGTAEHLSTLYSMPLWLSEKLIARHGYEHTEAFFKVSNSQRGLTIQVNRLRACPEDYARALARQDLSYELIDGLPGCIELEGGAAERLPGYEEGLFYVQDRAARLAVEIAGPKPGMKVLDACASPGGKSFAAAIAMEDRGSILSCDIHEKKLGLIASGARRLGICCISTQARDAREPVPQEIGSYDLVIADVPCSGLGVMAKKPEIRYKDPGSLAALPEIQGQILDALSELVKPGGTLLYSTCTILEEENEQVVEAFLRRQKGYRLEGFSLPGIDCPQGMYCFWPNVDGTDGFFAAKLKREI